MYKGDQDILAHAPQAHMNHMKLATLKGKRSVKEQEWKSV
jgi:hypothetical protein